MARSLSYVLILVLITGGLSALVPDGAGSFLSFLRVGRAGIAEFVLSSGQEMKARPYAPFWGG
jgi:hypothetical protein